MGWLLLTRARGESIIIGGDITVTVIDVRNVDVIVKVTIGDETKRYVIGVSEIVDLTDDIKIAIRDIRGNQGSIAVDAPKHIAVDREEVRKRKLQNEEV